MKRTPEWRVSPGPSRECARYGPVARTAHPRPRHPGSALSRCRSSVHLAPPSNIQRVPTPAPIGVGIANPREMQSHAANASVPAAACPAIACPRPPAPIPTSPHSRTRSSVESRVESRKSKVESRGGARVRSSQQPAAVPRQRSPPVAQRPKVQTAWDAPSDHAPPFRSVQFSEASPTTPVRTLVSRSVPGSGPHNLERPPTRATLS